MWIIPTNDTEPLLLDDNSLAGQHGWHRTATLTIQRSYRENGRVYTQTLEQFVMGRAPEGMVWKHVNGDRTNFLRANLVAMPRGRTLRGRGMRYVGVAPHGQKFRALIKLPGHPKPSYLGLHATEDEAARAVDQALIGAGMAPVNFPDAPVSSLQGVGDRT